MSLLKQILRPFVEFEDDKKNESVQKPTKQVVLPDNNSLIEENVKHPLITGTNMVSPQAPVTAARSSVTTILPEHKQYFEKLIDEANSTNPIFKGTDFKEFMDSKSDIDNITDEETRYKTAFNVLKRTGLTKEKLISTAHEYHNLIGRDLNAFQTAHTQQYQKEIRQREELIQKKAEELQALSQKINALKTEISQLSQEMTGIKDKLNITKNSFLLAGENMQQQIQEELQKIGRYF